MFKSIKVLSHTNLGPDRTTLLHLYRSLIRSKLDYWSIVYGSARKSYLQMYLRDFVWHWKLFVHLQYPALTRRQMSYHFGYVEENEVF